MRSIPKGLLATLLAVACSHALIVSPGAVNVYNPYYTGTFTAAEKGSIATGFDVWTANMGDQTNTTAIVLANTNPPSSIFRGSINFQKVTGTWAGHQITGTQSLDVAAVSVGAGGITVYTQVVMPDGTVQTVPWSNPTFATNAWIRAAARFLGLAFNTTSGSILNQNAILSARILLPSDADRIAFYGLYNTPSTSIPFPATTTPSGGAGYTDLLFKFNVVNDAGQVIRPEYSWGWANARSEIAAPPSDGILVLAATRYLIGSQFGGAPSTATPLQRAIDASGKQYFQVPGLPSSCNPTGLSFSAVTDDAWPAGVWPVDWTANAIPGITLIYLGQLSSGGNSYLWREAYAGNQCQEDLGYAVDLNPGYANNP